MTQPTNPKPSIPTANRAAGAAGRLAMDGPCFSRHGDAGEYADIRGTGGIGGYYSQDLDVLAVGERVGLHNAELGLSVIGVIRSTRHTGQEHVFTFEGEGFRVLVGTEPVTASWQSWQWASPRGADFVHAVVRATDCRIGARLDALTQRYSPQEGRSLAAVDMTRDGAPGREWRYGSPYRCDLGALRMWCLHCGAAMPANTGCTPGRTHRAVEIWTPHGWACATPSQNMTVTEHLRDRDGLPRLDPFDAARIDEAATFCLSDMVEWFDCGMDGVEYFVPEDIYEHYTGPGGDGRDDEPSA